MSGNIAQSRSIDHGHQNTPLGLRTGGGLTSKVGKPSVMASRKINLCWVDEIRNGRALTFDFDARQFCGVLQRGNLDFHGCA